jgi:peptidoglycan endopeptidase LytE
VKRFVAILTAATVGLAAAPPASAHVEDGVKLQRAHIVFRARARLGANYCWGGEWKCFDCSGLTYRVFTDHGTRLPRSTRDQWRARHRDGWRVIEVRRQLRHGDLLFFRNTYRRGISHVGIYIGRGRFIHSGDTVEVASLRTSYWRRHYHAGLRPPALRYR